MLQEQPAIYRIGYQDKSCFSQFFRGRGRALRYAEGRRTARKDNLFKAMVRAEIRGCYVPIVDHGAKEGVSIRFCDDENAVIMSGAIYRMEKVYRFRLGKTNFKILRRFLRSKKLPRRYP